MKLRVEPVLTYLSASNSTEIKLVDSILAIKDPDAKRDPRFKSGDWDGIHHFYDSDVQGFLSGLVPYLCRKLTEAKIPFEIQTYDLDIKREQVALARLTPDILTGMILRDYQIDAVRLAIQNGRGIVDVAPGGGKTLIMAAILKILDVPSLTLVDRARAVNKTIRNFKEMGVVGLTDDWSPSAKHVVTTVQALYASMAQQDESAFALITSREALLVNECQHQSADSWMAVGLNCPATYRWGFSGTPFYSDDVYGDKDPNDFKLIGMFGDPVIHIPSTFLRKRGELVTPTVYMLPAPCRVIKQIPNYRYAHNEGIVKNEMRNNLLASIAKKLYDRGHKVLILVERLDQGRNFLLALKALGHECIFAAGAQTVFKLHENGGIMESKDEDDVEVEKYNKADKAIMIGSTVFDEDVDIPTITTLIVASGGRSKRRLLQRVGRAIRTSEGKEEALVIDTHDTAHFYLAAQSRKRLERYRLEEYQVMESVPMWMLGH